MNLQDALQIKVGNQLGCDNNLPLEGNKIAPKLIIGDTYIVKQITHDKQGNPHFDVGIVSELNYVTSFETKEELLNGDKFHWCHPSRFTLLQ